MFFFIHRDIYSVEYNVNTMNDKNKKLDGISHGKAVRRTTPLIASQPSNNTNVYKDIETTKSKLRNLANRWMGVNKIRGFLTELWETLGINKVDNKQQKGGNPSRYAAFILQDGTILTITIRASTHNARAKNYLKKGNVNGDINLSIVLQKRRKKNRYEPLENVRLIEYVYLEDRIKNIENPLSQIAMSLVGYLTNGQYIDTTGVGITPSKSEQIKEYKIDKNMVKNKIRITENELKQIVNESVKKVLNENQYGIVTENPEINQLWNELMTLKNGLLKKVLLKYGWGKYDEIGGKFAVRQLRAISEAIGTFNAILQGTTADNEEYWSRIEHEQD